MFVPIKGLQKFCEITKHGMTRGNKINGVNSVWHLLLPEFWEREVSRLIRSTVSKFSFLLILVTAFKANVLCFASACNKSDEICISGALSTQLNAFTNQLSTSSNYLLHASLSLSLTRKHLLRHGFVKYWWCRLYNWFQILGLAFEVYYYYMYLQNI